jgi:signal transduction histidine kinase
MVLALLLVGVGLLYALLSVSVTRSYLQEVSQRLNRELAANLVADRQLVDDGRIDEKALAETFAHYMVVNPSIEIYLLDVDGRILSYSADPGKVQRARVALEPIRTFLSGEDAYPVLGDDPRNLERRKAFSVTPIPSAVDTQRYLYVILRGEQFDSVDQMLRESHFLRLSAWAVTASLVFGLLVGLLVFRILTRRLHRLTRLMNEFRDGGFAGPVRYLPERAGGGDEIDQLGSTFEQMATRIAEHLHALKHNDTLRRELAANVSHDLRTPLASLHGYLETLHIKDEDLTHEQRLAYLSTALRSSTRLSRLVEELFELAKLDASEVQPCSEPFSMPELAQDVLQKFQLRADRQGIGLDLQRADDALFVFADISLIERVLQNLLENALEHTPKRGRVGLTVRRDAERVTVGVTDTGRGICEQDLARIFERFYQARDGHRGSDHAGLGLAIAKRIIELHGSEILVKSEAGKGATFEFSLPAWHA